jgi:uncharacterized protein with PQ loop repeat
MSQATHHFSLHRAVTRKRSVKTVDTMAYGIGVVGNAAVIPQIIEAWKSSAPGMAILTWIFFIAIGVIWLAYAILHKQKPLILAQSISTSASILVVLGWLYHHWL